MRADPHLRELLEREAVGGIAAGLARDRSLAYGGGRLSAFERIIEPYVKEPRCTGRFAVDLAAGTAVYTTAFAARWRDLYFVAVDRNDPESSQVYPTGVHQTREALRVMAEECQPTPVVAAVPGQAGSGPGGGRRLLFVSDGPPRCAVREGDVVALRGLQSAPNLNGRMGCVLGARPGGQRFAVHLMDEASVAGGSEPGSGGDPKALKPANLEYQHPGWLQAGEPAAAGELERLQVLSMLPSATVACCLT